MHPNLFLIIEPKYHSTYGREIIFFKIGCFAESILTLFNACKQILLAIASYTIHLRGTDLGMMGGPRA